MMLEIVVACTLAFVVLVLVGAVSAEFTRRLWNGSSALAICFALVGVGMLGWLQFLATWASPAVGKVFSFAIIALVLIAAGRLRVWRVLWAGRGILGISLGILLVYLGMTYLWASDLDPFSLTALRFSFHESPYPVDNALPYLMANKLQEGMGTHGLLLSWNGSDRPPLESGVIIVFQSVFGQLGFRGDTVPFAVGVVLQLAWIPALFASLRILQTNRWISLVTVIFVGSTGTMLINTTYTWPKLISAALVLAAMTLLVAVYKKAIPTRWGVGVAAGTFTLGLLAHGAAAFLVSAIVLLAILVFRSTDRRWLTVIVAGVTAAVLYLPWTIYQRFVDPPGDRLLKWHLAGVTGIDNRSFARTLLDSYSSVSPFDLLSSKIENLRVVFGGNIVGGYGGPSDASIGARRFHEYYETSSALSLSVLVIVGIAVYSVVRLVQRRTLFRRELILIMLLMIPCIAFWCAAMFIPGGTVVHQGSHVWIMILMGFSFAWLCSVRVSAGVVLLSVQLAVTAVYYGPFFAHNEIRVSAIFVTVFGVATVIAALIASRRRGAGPIPVGAYRSRTVEHGSPR